MLRRLGVQTAGESHGKGVLATITGVPAGVVYAAGVVDGLLARRQAGFGRSSRQQIEQDRAEVLAGLYRGRTTGAPLVLAVWNRDDSLADKPAVHRPRPGHADLAGGQKYATTDMRPVLERASARETAARVAAGGLAELVLSELGIELLGHVLAVGRVRARGGPGTGGLAGLRRRRDRSPFHCLDGVAEGAMTRAVVAARRAGDTLGGIIEVRALGVPAGLGSLEGFGSRLDARLGGALLSIPAVKAVEVGDGIEAASRRGSEVHDPIGRPGPKGPTRRSNRAGGIEGGMSNGEAVVAHAYMKPIPTLRQPLPSWNFARNAPEEAYFERSDVTAVPAAAIVAEAMVALVLLDALLEKTGGDTLSEVARSLAVHRRTIARYFGRPSVARRGAGHWATKSR